MTLNLLIILFFFVFSYLISNLYVNGDQQIYLYLYNSFASLDLYSSYLIYANEIYNFEFIHFFISWLFGYYSLDKNIIMSCFNVTLYLLIFNYCNKILLVNRWYLHLFLLTNFHLYTLYFSAERLKFGCIFFLLSFLYMNNKRKSINILFSVTSVFSHIQMIIPYIFIYLSTVLKYFKFKFSLNTIFYLALSIAVILLIIPTAYDKFLAYSESSVDRNISLDFFRILIYMVGAYFCSNKKYIIFYFMPLFLMVLLIGGERVNQIAYFIFIYFSFRYSRGVDIISLSINVYFSCKSLLFIDNVIEFGNGLQPNIL